MPSIKSSVIRSAVKLLSESNAPLVTGLEVLDMDSQIAAWKLADIIGATIDSSLGSSSRAKSLAMQKFGKVTATYGAIGQQADLLVVWYNDPIAGTERDFDLIRSYNKKDQKLVVVDCKKTATAARAQHFFQMATDDAICCVSRLHRRIVEMGFTECVHTADDQRTDDDADRLFSLLEEAESLAMVLPKASDSDAQWDLLTEMLFQLTNRINKTKPAFLTSFSHSNQSGAEYCLALVTGFPFAVDLGRSKPRFCYSSYSSLERIQSGHSDVVVIFTNDQTKIPDEMKATLSRQSVIEIGAGIIPDASVLIESTPGSKSGTFKFLRADGVMLETPVDLGEEYTEALIETLIQELGVDSGI